MVRNRYWSRGHFGLYRITAYASFTKVTWQNEQGAWIMTVLDCLPCRAQRSQMAPIP